MIYKRVGQTILVPVGTIGSKTVSITALSIMALSTKGLFGTLSIKTLCHYASDDMLSVAFLRTNRLNVIMLNVVRQKVTYGTALMVSSKPCSQILD
jgi:hypothetical protein